MPKVTANWKDKQLVFDHFIVKRESPHFVGVYHRGGAQYGQPITSAPTLPLAARKAKLLELGYSLGYKDAKECYSDGYRWD